MQQSTIQRIDEMRNRVSLLEDRVAEEIGLFGTGGKFRRSFSEHDIEEVFNKNIGAICQNSPGERVLSASLDVMDAYLDFMDDPDFLSSIGPLPELMEPINSYTIKQMKYQMISFRLKDLLEGLPPMLDYARETGMAHEFCRIANAVLRITKNTPQSRYVIPSTFYNSMVPIKDKENALERTYLHTLNRLKEEGFGKYVEDILHVLDRVGEIYTKEVHDAMAILPEVFSEARRYSLMKEMDSLISLLKKTRLDGSAFYSRMRDFMKDAKDWEIFAEPEFYSQINNLLERVASGNPCFVDLASHSNLLKVFASYRQKGMRDMFMPMLEFAVSEHENDNLTNPEDLRLGVQPYGQVFLKNFPEMHELAGPRAMELYKEIVSKVKTPVRRSVALGNNCVMAVLRENPEAVNDWIYYIAALGTEEDFKDPREIMGISMIHSATEKAVQGIDIGKYAPFADMISKLRLHEHIEQIDDVLFSDLPRKQKARLLERYGLIRRLPGIPKPMTDGVKWFGETAEIMGITPENLVSLMAKLRPVIKKDENLQLVERLSTRYLEKTIAFFDTEFYSNIGMDMFSFSYIFSSQARMGDIRIFENYLKSSNLNTLKFDQCPDFVKRTLASIYLTRLASIHKTGLDYEKTLELMPGIFSGGFFERGYLGVLEAVINSDESTQAKLDFLAAASKERALLTFSSPKNCNFEEWRTEAMAAMRSFMATSGRNRYSEEYTLNLLRCAQSERAAHLLKQIIDLEKKGLHNKALFKPGTVYYDVELGGLNSVPEYTRGVFKLVLGLISYNPENVTNSFSVFSEDYILKARELIFKSHVKPESFYHHMNASLSVLNWEVAPHDYKVELANNILEFIKSTYLSSTKDIPGKWELRAMVNQLYMLRDKEAEFFNGITGKMQDWTLEDLRDGKRLHSCVFLSQDREAEEIASLFYHADPHIGVLQITPRILDRYLGPIGAGIMVNCYDKQDNLVLALDSLEGGVMLDAIPERLWLEAAMKGIAGSAVDTGSAYIFLNHSGLHGKSQKFLHLAASYLGLGSPTDMHLAKLQGNGLLDIGKGERHLDMWEQGRPREQCAGKATGHLIPTPYFVEAAGYGR